MHWTSLANMSHLFVSQFLFGCRTSIKSISVCSILRKFVSIVVINLLNRSCMDVSCKFSSQRCSMALLLFSSLFCLLNFVLLLLIPTLTRKELISTSSQGSLAGSEDNGLPKKIQTRLDRKSHANVNCSFATCFEIGNCVSLERPKRFSSEELNEDSTCSVSSSSYAAVQRAHRSWMRKNDLSSNSSCLTLSQNSYLDLNSVQNSESSESLPCNTLVFNFIPRASVGYTKLVQHEEDAHRHGNLFGAAMVASSAHLTSHFREHFDVSVPYPLSLQHLGLDLAEDTDGDRHPFVLFTGLEKQAAKRTDGTTIVLEFCDDSKANVNHILERCGIETQSGDSTKSVHGLTSFVRRSEFCVLPKDSWYHQTDLSLALKFGCIPVITSSAFVLPFHSLIDWKLSSVYYLGDHSLDKIVSELRRISRTQKQRLRTNGREIYSRYFSSVESIVSTTLDIISERIKVLLENDRGVTSCGSTSVGHSGLKLTPERDLLPRFRLPSTSMATQFTAVILTHDIGRVDCLFQIVKTLMEVDELCRVLIVWNNNEHRYVSSSTQQHILNRWPPLAKPLKVVNMLSNTITNRFIPYKDIDTEAVFSLDDDMTGLTSQDVRRAFQIWKLNSNRLVGFLQHSFSWSSVTEKWHLSDSSENSVSILSTGAMFYNSQFSYLFSYHFESGTDSDKVNFIESHKNCEDVAFNLFVANLTKLQPIIVLSDESSRLEGKCGGDMSSKVDSQVFDKSQCLQYFNEFYPHTIHQMHKNKFVWKLV